MAAPSTSSPRFSWLHLSDLRWGAGSAQAWPHLRDALLQDLERLASRCGPWDVVFITGDSTAEGTAKAFEEVEGALTELREGMTRLGKEPAILAVPGDGDLAVPERLAAVHRELRSCGVDGEARSALWGEEPEGREALEELFDAYLGRWAEPWAPGRWSLRRGRLPGEWSLSIPWGERCLGVVGLNSAAASVGGTGAGVAREHLDVRQLHGVCDGDGPRWLSEHDLCLLLTHHGPSELSPASLEALRGGIDVPGRFLAHLHGSVSASALVDAREGKAQLRRRFAASPLGLDGDAQGRGGGYIIGCLERGEDGCHVSMRLWPRSLEMAQDGVARFGVDRQVACEEDGGTPAEHLSLGAPAREADEPGPPPAFTDDPEHDARALLQWSAHGGDEATVRERYAQVMGRTGSAVVAAQPTSARAASVGSSPQGTEPDALLAGRFQLLERLGQGGFGEVWGAYDREARRPVVIKRLRADGHHPPERRAERARHFRAGAEAMARVDHRGLVPVLPLDASTVVGLDGAPFYAMRWLVGGNLLEFVGGYVGPGSSLAPEQRVIAGRRALARALEGLAYLHEQGVVHRDVKPNNILLDEDLRGYLGDFDLVRDSRSTLLPTRIGGHVYIAPELVNGWGADARADVYAAGMCALFVLTGQDPPQRVEADAPELIDGLDCEEQLKAAIRHAVNPRREARPERCAELVRALRGDRAARGGGEPLEVSAVPPKWRPEAASESSGEDRLGGTSIKAEEPQAEPTKAEPTPTNKGALEFEATRGLDSPSFNLSARWPWLAAGLGFVGSVWFFGQSCLETPPGELADGADGPLADRADGSSADRANESPVDRADGSPADSADGSPADSADEPGLWLEDADDPPGWQPQWAVESGEDGYGKWASFEVEGVRQKMRWIEPGEFTMGSPEVEEGRFADEGPAHRVRLSAGYWMADTETTQALWEAVMGSNPSSFEGVQRPVEWVSWEQVVEFIDALNAKVAGEGFGLPTEAQWEYAARAGTEGARYGELDAVAWHGGNSNSQTHEVAGKAANGWGLYDMLGNVWEWTADADYEYEAGGVTDPEHSTGPERVIRGGSWDDGARDVRAAYRHWNVPGGRYGNLGFRLVRGQKAEPQDK